MKKANIELSIKDATIDIYLRENISKDIELMPAVIICPGGGYKYLSDRESEPLALSFLSQGYQVIVLNYTLVENESSINSEYLQKNISLVREVFELINTKKFEWLIDPSMVFILGCSAGGHLAALYSNLWMDTTRLIVNFSYKPLGTILCYPVIGLNYGWPTKKDGKLENFPEHDVSNLVNNGTPNSFIWHTSDDKSVPVVNTLKYCEHLALNGINFECHIFEEGVHGLSLANRSSAKFQTEKYINTNIAKWFSYCITWMERQILKS